MIGASSESLLNEAHRVNKELQAILELSSDAQKRSDLLKTVTMAHFLACKAAFDQKVIDVEASIDEVVRNDKLFNIYILQKALQSEKETLCTHTMASHGAMAQVHDRTLPLDQYKGGCEDGSCWKLEHELTTDIEGLKTHVKTRSSSIRQISLAPLTTRLVCSTITSARRNFSTSQTFRLGSQ
jgi:hypothetical protein